MWTKTIEAIHRGTDGSLTVKVKFVKDTWEVTEAFVARGGEDLNWLKDRVNDKERALDALNTFAASITNGAFDSTVVVPEPTKEDTDRNSWIEKNAKLDKMRAAVKNGLMKENDETFVALEAEVKAGFKAEYLDRM